MNDYDDRSRGWGLFWMYAGLALLMLLPSLVGLWAVIA